MQFLIILLQKREFNKMFNNNLLYILFFLVSVLRPLPIKAMDYDFSHRNVSSNLPNSFLPNLHQNPIPSVPFLSPNSYRQNSIAFQNPFCKTVEKYKDGYDSEEDSNWSYPPSRSDYWAKSIEHNIREAGFSVFFRGVHLFPKYFPDSKSRANFLRNSQVGNPIFSPATFKELNINYTSLDERGISLERKDCQKHDEALKASENIKQQIIKLRKDIHKRVRNETYDFTLYTALHYSYVKSYSTFIDIELKKFGNEFTFRDNPFVSVSAGLWHPLKYAFGAKIKEHTPLSPQFDHYGKPQYPYLGKVYLILVPNNEISQGEIFKVAEAYKRWKGAGNPKYCNQVEMMLVKIRTSKEKEVIFPGFISGEYIIYEHIVRVPNFRHSWKKDHESKYGLTKKKYNNIKKDFREGKIPDYENLIGSNELAHFGRLLNKAYQEALKRAPTAASNSLILNPPTRTSSR